MGYNIFYNLGSASDQMKSIKIALDAYILLLAVIPLMSTPFSCFLLIFDECFFLSIFMDMLNYK